ncbi:MAG: hypothetical protein FWG36_07060 [Oscillospiraceae bacterium]|nr:hypothetical protein [Oscillospiraceae bacterium]
MREIPHSFCGYISIDDDVFVCSVTGHTVKLLPAHDDSKSIGSSVWNIQRRKAETPEFLFGVDEWNYEIALLRQTDFKDVIGVWNCTSFGAPIVIQSVGNMHGFYEQLTKDWTKFDAIAFVGGNINDVYNPKIVALKRKSRDEINEYANSSSGARTIEIKPFSEYTHTADVIIDEQKIKVTISVSQNSGEENLKTTEIGSLASIIRLEFENPQDFTSIERHYIVIRSALALLTRQNNIGFSVSLHQKNNSGQFVKTGICRVNDGFDDYSKRQYHSVISLGAFTPYLPHMIEMVSKNEADAILSLLPRSNKNLSRITITNVQDLCTALEVEYNKVKGKPKKDSAIEELKKEINSTIAHFLDTHTEIDVYNQTTISSAFQYLDYTLKDKIFFLYNENRDIVDSIAKKWSCPELTLESIGSFVKLRNMKTHSGTIEWGDSDKLYLPLFALVYACFFKRMGLPDSDTKRTVAQIF